METHTKGTAKLPGSSDSGNAPRVGNMVAGESNLLIMNYECKSLPFVFLCWTSTVYMSLFKFQVSVMTEKNGS